MKDFKYKAGDLVYCYNDSKWEDIILNKKNNTYKIVEVNNIYIEVKIEPKTVEITDNRKDNMISKTYLSSFLYTHKDFYKYFLSNIQYRKIKLEKLNDRF